MPLDSLATRPSQKTDLLFEDLSLLQELTDHRILSRRKRAASPFACLDDFARQPEQRVILSFLVGD